MRARQAPDSPTRTIRFFAVELVLRGWLVRPLPSELTSDLLREGEFDPVFGQPGLRLGPNERREHPHFFPVQALSISPLDLLSPPYTQLLLGTTEPPPSIWQSEAGVYLRPGFSAWPSGPLRGAAVRSRVPLARGGERGFAGTGPVGSSTTRRGSVRPEVEEGAGALASRFHGASCPRLDQISGECS